MTAPTQGRRPAAIGSHEDTPERGLVLCAISPRDLERQVPDTFDLADLWSPRFPDAALVAAAVALFTPPEASDVGPSGIMVEGPRRLMSVAGGMVQFARRNLVRAGRTHEARELRRIAGIDDRARIATAAQRWIPTVERLVLRAVELGVVLSSEVEEYRWLLLGEFVLRPDAGQHVPDPGDGEPWWFEWRRPLAGTRRMISGWSAKSRARMCKAMCSIDWSPMVDTGRPFAMVTLTAPGDWEVVFPTRAAWNAAVERFVTRYERAWAEPLSMFWKVEFQARGAPHLHGLTAPPHGLSNREMVNGGLSFMRWLSITWAECVDPARGAGRAPGEFDKHVRAGTGVDFAEGLRASDPKRAAVYFLGHNTAGHPGGKEYQHQPPALWVDEGTVGRFWGRRGLGTSVSTFELTPADYTAAVRLVRRWSRAQRQVRKVSRLRYPGGRVTGDQWDVGGLAAVELLTSREKVRPRRRRQTVRVERCGQGAGWVAVNDGPSFAGDIARWLDMITEECHA